jgi:hypothetical protein
MAQSLRSWSKTAFGYPPSQGIPGLREAIAKHVAFAARGRVRGGRHRRHLRRASRPSTCSRACW